MILVGVATTLRNCPCRRTSRRTAPQTDSRCDGVARNLTGLSAATSVHASASRETGCRRARFGQGRVLTILTILTILTMLGLAAARRCACLRVAVGALLAFATRGGGTWLRAMGRGMLPAGAPSSGWLTADGPHPRGNERFALASRTPLSLTDRPPHTRWRGSACTPS